MLGLTMLVWEYGGFRNLDRILLHASQSTTVLISLHALCAYETRRLTLLVVSSNR